MEIRTLRYFLAVAREENMTRAAAYLHVTQPTLSKQIQSLEDELGKKLFIRHSFRIELTEEGVLLRKRAEDLVALADKIAGEFTALDDVTGGDVSFGLAESYQIRALAREIKQFKAVYPGLRYHISSGDTEQVTEKLDKGVLDFAVLAEEPDRAKYHALPFPEADVWGLVMPADHPLAQKRTSARRTSRVCRCSAPSKAGSGTSPAGAAATQARCASRGRSACPTMPRCLFGRGWGSC